MFARRWLSLLLVSAVALCTPSLLSAQSNAAPKVEVFGGYSWYHPGQFNGVNVPDFDKGWGAQLTYNLNHWAGLTLDAGGHYEDQGKAHTVAGGPKFTLRRGHIMPFGEILLGISHFSPNQAPDDTQFALISGLGVDYKVTPRLSIRPIQADYVFTYYNALSPAGTSNMLSGVRLQAGLVFNFGIPKTEVPVSASCSAQPSAVDAGTPVQISVTPSGFLPKRTLSYSYASTGGKISGNAASTSVDTTGMEAGNYTVSARITDNGKGKNQQMASCQATFAVNAKRPPSLSVSANPDSLNSGDTSAITAVGGSPDNRPLSYSCSATGGTLSGNGPRYTLDTTGASAGTINVNCTVSDDRNLTASASTAVAVHVPAPPAKIAPAVVPQANKFGSIDFKRDKKRPTRVDNEAKGELDRYADALAAAPDSKGVIVGYATAKEPGKYASQRAVNTKDYVTREKGIDPARIDVRSGSGDQIVDLWIVPAGATFSSEGTAGVDESSVKAVPRVAMKAKKMHKKKAD